MVVLELRQPMTAVSGQVQRAQHLIRTDPKSASEAMKEVVAQIERIDRILDELHERVGTSPIPATARGHRPARQEE
jgi:signal transduction histidine kinase